MQTRKKYKFQLLKLNFFQIHPIICLVFSGMELSEEQKQLLKQLKTQLASNLLIQAKEWDPPELVTA